MHGTALAQRSGSSDPLPGIGLTTTVPRELVHRSAVAEVLLTGSTGLGEGRYALTGQWPRAHAFFTDDSGPRHDPMIAAETIRQAGLYLAHTAFGVPVSHAFLLRRMDFAAVAEQLAIGSRPTDIDLEAALGHVRRRRTSTSVELRFVIRRDHHVVATGGGEFVCLAPAVYLRMRGRHAHADINTLGDRLPPVPAAVVGRQAAKDVVLAATDAPGRWTVSPDPRNAVLFDHGGDHMPGMVLLEAARQAAHALLGPLNSRPLAASTEFRSFAELDAPCVVEARWDGPAGPAGTVEVTGRQADETVFTSRLNGGGPPSPPAVPAVGEAHSP